MAGLLSDADGNVKLLVILQWSAQVCNKLHFDGLDRTVTAGLFAVEQLIRMSLLRNVIKTRV